MTAFLTKGKLLRVSMGMEATVQITDLYNLKGIHTVMSSARSQGREGGKWRPEAPSLKAN